LRHGKKAKVAQRGNYGILQPKGARGKGQPSQQ
jgi:hypothetical protein